VIILFSDSTSAELGTLNDALQELLDGIQVDLSCYITLQHVLFHPDGRERGKYTFLIKKNEVLNQMCNSFPDIVTHKKSEVLQFH
jgi:hypothetical protein